MVQYILWDFEGTLAYRRASWSRMLYMLVKEYGIEDMPIHRIQLKINRCFPWNHPSQPHVHLLQEKNWWTYVCENITELLISEGIEPAIAKEIGFLRFRESYLQDSYWRLYKDTIPVLQQLKEKGLIQLIASNHVPELEEIAAYVKIDGYFQHIFSSANVGYDKPNRGFFQYVIAHCEKNAQFIMIGNSFTDDIAGAHAIGIPAILVRNNIHKSKTPYYCHHIAGVPSMLNQLVQV